MLNSSAPIGVFDSGVGGLTVLRSLAARMPHERFLYLGDLARVPYGSKSPETVLQYSFECASYLSEQGVKAIVVACNTATALALNEIRTHFEVPIFGVIDAGVRAALQCAKDSSGVIVLGTVATIRSGAYRDAFQKLAPGVSVEEIACPLLVPLAEEGWFDDEVTERVIRSYLAQVQKPYGTVVLGCTHYPLLLPSFRRVLGKRFALVHGADVLAGDVERALSERGLLSQDSTGPSAIRYLSTDERTDVLFASKLFEHPVVFEKVCLELFSKLEAPRSESKRAAPPDPMYL